MSIGRRVLIVTCALALMALGAGLVAAPGAARAQVVCTELIVNGGFEQNAVWQFGVSPVQPRYATGIVHGGTQAMLMGIDSGPNINSYSSVRQTVSIPANATQVSISFWYYALVNGAPGNDYMALDLLSADGLSILGEAWRATADSRVYQQVTRDLSAWRGQTVQIYFNVYNDGASGTTAMYLDDVSLSSCTGGTPGVVTATNTNTPQTPVVVTATNTPQTPLVATFTPTTTPQVVTATPTPWIVVVTNTPQTAVVVTNTPGPVVATATGQPQVVPTIAPPVVGPPGTDCVDLIRNGGFEEGFNGWLKAPNKLPVAIESSNVHSGARALQLGTQTTNANSYSSIRQTVTIPPTYPVVQLQFWTYTWADTAGGSDHQEADFLAPDPQVLRKWWRDLYNDRAWVQRVFDVSEYAGQTVVVYFNVVNDGLSGRAGMYLDDVHLYACGAGAAAQGVVAQAQPQPQGVVTIVVTATPSPTGSAGARSLQPQAVPGGGLQPPPYTPVMTSVVLSATATATQTPGASVGTSPLAPTTPPPAPVGTDIFSRLFGWIPRPPAWPAWWPLALLLVIAIVILLVRFIPEREEF